MQRSISHKACFNTFLSGVIVLLITAWGGAVSAQSKWNRHDDVLSISFPTESDGWASGRWGTIIHTSNGGRTWSSQESGTNNTLVSVCFTDPQNGWAVGVKGTIVHTSDGGKIWEIQESPVGYFHMDVYFVTPLKGWIVSERTHILATDDGGATWRVQFKDEDFVLKAISFGDAYHGWAVGEFGYVYFTSDGGRTWEKQAGYYDLNEEENGEVVGDPSLFDVKAIDESTVWAVGIDGHVIRTIDAGKNWEKIAVGIPSVQLYCITSDGQGTLVIGGKGICQYSYDNGRTWQKANCNPSIQYSWINALALRGSSHFVAGGEEGALYFSSSVKTWARVNY